MVHAIDNRRVEGLAAAFMVDQVGIDHDGLARLMGTTADEVVSVIEGGGARTAPAAKALRCLAAIQSLLLSAYTPAGATTWMNTPNRDLDGISPREVLAGHGADRMARVLQAAYSRISS